MSSWHVPVSLQRLNSGSQGWDDVFFESTWLVALRQTDPIGQCAPRHFCRNTAPTTETGSTCAKETSIRVMEQLILQDTAPVDCSSWKMRGKVSSSFLLFSHAGQGSSCGQPKFEGRVVFVARGTFVRYPGGIRGPSMGDFVFGVGCGAELCHVGQVYAAWRVG